MKTILPPQTIGIIGGGQLGRMMAISAKQMGYKIASLDSTPNCPLAQVADFEIVGAYSDLAAIQKLAEISDVITYEFENISVEALEWLIQNAYVPQGSEVLHATKHRLREKQTIESFGIPVAPYHTVETLEDLKKGIEKLGLPAVLKTCTGGYDGKGQVVLHKAGNLSEAKPLIESTACVLEKWIPFICEVSVIVHRSPSGEVSVYPVGENIHKNQILHETIVPARITDKVSEKALRIGQIIADKFRLVGTLAIEMFVTEDEEIYVNELAPRPHNSGHYTMEACETSQFEQHIRSVCNLPLGAPRLLSPVVMVNVLGEHHDAVIASTALWKIGKVHLYGKADVKVGRKMGHVNVLGENVEEIIAQIDHMKIWNEK